MRIESSAVQAYPTQWQTQDRRLEVTDSETTPLKKQGDIWKELGGRYDVRAMDVDDMDALTMELYQRGEISLLDRAILTFDPAKGAAGDSEGYFRTATSGQESIDWIAEFEARSQEHLKYGDSISAANDQRILAILHRLEISGKGGLDVMA